MWCKCLTFSSDSARAGLATMFRSRSVIGSCLRDLAHVALSGILEPVAPSVKMGTCAMAAGEASLRGSTISKLSVLICSSLFNMALNSFPAIHSEEKSR